MYLLNRVDGMGYPMDCQPADDPDSIGSIEYPKEYGTTSASGNSSESVISIYGVVFLL